jgi:hypothetical protein
VSVVTETHLIAPHGGTLVDRTGSRPDGVDALETVTLSSRELSDLDMIASGALSPLEGFMGREDYDRVVEDMHLSNGLAWALPVCLAVEAATAGDRVALADGNGRPLAGSIDERPTMRRDQRLRNSRLQSLLSHAATSTGSSPSRSSSATTSAALSSGVCASVSRTISGLVGSS